MLSPTSRIADDTASDTGFGFKYFAYTGVNTIGSISTYTKQRKPESSARPKPDKGRQLSMSERLKGKIGIVTGAGSGIGRACAVALAREGARVALFGRRKERIEDVAREIGDHAFAIGGDVSKKDDLNRLLQATVARFGGLNFLVNNAGILHIGNAEQITEDQWEQTFNVNVTSVWLLSRGALPQMRKAGGGSIINIASVLGVVGARNRAAYAPSKGAVVLLTKSMAADHGHENIRVNAICPSFVESELTAGILSKVENPETFRRERIAAHPIGRLGRPEDIASLTVYLASDESSWMTGATLPVDGGYSAV
jgi:NAD(P)-dependent dehydrogenase (short-subunit alcohol dehydrogenase family)